MTNDWFLLRAARLLYLLCGRDVSFIRQCSSPCICSWVSEYCSHLSHTTPLEMLAVHLLLALLAALLILASFWAARAAAQSNEADDGRLLLVTSMNAKFTSHALVKQVISEQKKLGVPASNIVVLLNEENGTRDADYIAAEQMLTSLGIGKIVPWVFTYSSAGRSQLEAYVRAELKMGKRDWVIWIDMDEVPDLSGKTYAQLVKECEREGYTHVIGYLRDRLTSSGALIEVQENVSLAEQFPLKCALTERLVKGTNSKVCVWFTVD